MLERVQCLAPKITRNAKEQKTRSNLSTVNQVKLTQLSE